MSKYHPCHQPTQRRQILAGADRQRWREARQEGDKRGAGVLMELDRILKHFEAPFPFLSRSITGSRPFRVPHANGIYGFYFRNYPKVVIDTNTLEKSGFRLLYIGISPSRTGTHQKLRDGIKKHLFMNASVSTLRTSLGCVLADNLGLHMVKRGKKYWFGNDEEILDRWLEKNMRFTWYLTPSPWLYESELLKVIQAPLNLEGNKHHNFYPVLSNLRYRLKQNAFHLKTN